MAEYQSLLTDAAQLPVGQRIELIEALWETVSRDSLPALSDEWRAEILRRSAEFDSGMAKPIPWEQVRSEARQRAGLGASHGAN
jgi:putative addiction module component (TIGR02574 family)